MNSVDFHCPRISDGDCPNFHAVKMGLSPLAFKCFVALLIFFLVQGNTVSAQTVLDRLEQQIRQRVNPSQGGAPPTPPNRAITPSPDASFSNAAQDTNKPESGYLGLTVDDRKDRGRGVRVTEVRSGSPADKAGFRKQDLVTALMDVRVRQLSEMTEILRLYQPDDIVEFDILRDGRPQKIKVTLGRRPNVPTPASQTAEVIPLPPGELILPDPQPAKITPPTAQTNSQNDRETIERLRSRIVELEQRVADLERALSEAQKNK